jgi:hypothetical protein
MDLLWWSRPPRFPNRGSLNDSLHYRGRAPDAPRIGLAFGRRQGHRGHRLGQVGARGSHGHRVYRAGSRDSRYFAARRQRDRSTKGHQRARVAPLCERCTGRESLRIVPQQDAVFRSRKSPVTESNGQLTLVTFLSN